MACSIRQLEERTDWGHVATEWEPVTDVDTSHWTDKQFRDWVRAANAQAKAEGSLTRFRSVPAEDAF